MGTHDDQLQDASPSRRPARTSSHEGGLLLALGTLCSATGLALAILPRFSWKANQIMVGLDYLGVHAGTLVMGGVALMGLGMVRRALEASRRDDDEERDRELLLEQVATDLVEMRTSLEELDKGSSALTQELASLREDVAKASQRAEAQPEQGSQDALFQLAASLDKLGARLDQRLKVYHSTVQESLEGLSNSVEHSRRWFEERLAEIPTPAVEPEPVAVQAQAALEVEAESPAPAAPQHRSLGVLDALDDDSVHAPLPARAQDGSIDFDRLDAGAQGYAKELDLASRARASGPWDEQLMVEPTAGDMAQKLEQLQSLLSDDRLRAALENMRRQA